VGLVYVKGLSYRLANTEEEALNLLFEGETNRTIGQHVLNKQSSRSHCIFTIVNRMSFDYCQTDDKYTVSKINLSRFGRKRTFSQNERKRNKKTNVFFFLSRSF
jgi:kinesin family protein 6/9